MGTRFKQDGQTGFMSTSDFDSHRVDNLFLLVGENPLPNYVAARLLLKKGGTPYLVYTNHTKEPAVRLQQILGNGNESMGWKTAQLISLEEYDADAYHIQKRIRSRLEPIENGRIGLNYTGGTKAMAVHAYRAIFSQVRPVFSYLDPRRLEMCIDREDGERIRIKVTPDVLEVKLQDIFQIHGLQLKNEFSQEVRLPELATVLAKVFQDTTKQKQWFSWYHESFCKEARKQKKNGSLGDWKSETDLKELLISIENAPPEVVTYFKQEEWMTQNDELSLQTVQQKGGLKKIKHFCEYLDGLWLEHYVLQQVKSIAKKSLIKDYGLNFEVPLPGTRDGFEFDVAFTRGYQLFAISVSTTKDRKLCKSKLFEAYLRAVQMGGDEARVALVCCNDEPNALKAEMALLDNKKIAVFGGEDLIGLSNKIEGWIQQNDRNTK